MKIFFSLLTIIMIAAPFAHAADPADDSLILYFSFDELDGDTVTDHSQYGNDGTIAGSPELVAGKFGNALKFNGQTDWVEVPHADILTVDTNVTIMAWINAERHMGPNEQQWQGILSKGNSPRSYSFYTESPSECLHLSAGGSGSICEAKIPLNEWQHVVAQVEDGTHRYWLNGEHAGEFGEKNGCRVPLTQPLFSSGKPTKVTVNSSGSLMKSVSGIVPSVWKRSDQKWKPHQHPLNRSGSCPQLGQS